MNGWILLEGLEILAFIIIAGCFLKIYSKIKQIADKLNRIEGRKK